MLYHTCQLQFGVHAPASNVYAMCIYICTYICVCVSTLYLQMLMLKETFSCVRARTHQCIHASMHTRINAGTRPCKHTSMQARVNAYAHQMQTHVHASSHRMQIQGRIHYHANPRAHRLGSACWTSCINYHASDAAHGLRACGALGPHSSACSMQSSDQ